MSIAVTINRYSGIGHTGMVVRELKQCENCSRNFTRKRPERAVNDEGRTMGQRYCAECCRRYLLPEDDREYREMLPTSAEMKHREHITSSWQTGLSRIKQKRRSRRELDVWVDSLRMAFAKNGPMEGRQIVEASGADPNKYNGSNVIGQARKWGLTIVEVGNVWPRRSCMGPALKLYDIARD
jgi:hypothetical protein